MAAFSSQNRKSVCSYRGPPNALQALYTAECFESPFLVNDSSTAQCNVNYASIGSCLSDTECQLTGKGNICSSGTCLQQISNNPSQFYNRQSSHNIGEFKPLNSQVNRWIGDHEKRQLQSSGNLVFENMFVGTDADGNQFYGTPVQGSQPPPEQCGTCLKTIWRCNRFIDTGEIDKYNECKQMEQCLKYNIQNDNGRLIPISVQATPTCLGVLRASLDTCAVQCGNVKVDSRPAQANLGLFTRYVN